MAPYIPLYHDLSVDFSGPTSSGAATIHYVEAGSPERPLLVLLHGYPSSSKQFRDFIPLLSDSYYVLAPDMPGYGLTTVPDDFKYTFDNLSAVMSAWIHAVDTRPFALYMFDFGAPVGFRIALQHPEKIKALISQNGNAYKEGISEAFGEPIIKLWQSGNTEAEREALKDALLNIPMTKYQYVEGVPKGDRHLLNPESWTFDYLQNIAGERNTQRQLDLFYDYRTNPELYPKIHEYFRKSKVPILAVWGKNDPAFLPAGAEAFKNDSPNAVVKLVDAGHFALETKRWEIADIMKQWLASIDFV